LETVTQRLSHVLRSHIRDMSSDCVRLLSIDDLSHLRGLRLLFRFEPRHVDVVPEGVVDATECHVVQNDASPDVDKTLVEGPAVGDHVPQAF
jgi:hypothetical protein